jgi:site-specific DNA-methyltransferase (adenine-specific)
MTGIFHIVVARKPIEGTIAENCLQWGCGALNIDGCRIGSGEILGGGGGKLWSHYRDLTQDRATPKMNLGQGRFPANLILGGEEVAREFPVTRNGGQNVTSIKGRGMFMNGSANGTSNYSGDSGSASRFFYNFSEQESDE